MTLAENIAHALGKGKEQKSGDGWQTCCPVHDDKTPSLSIRDRTDGSGNPDITVNCYAGCDYKAVKDEIRASGHLPEWEPGNNGKHRPRNGSKTSAEGRKKNPAPYSGSSQGRIQRLKR